MAWTFRASGAQSSGNNASSLASIGLPSGWAAGDLHILHFQSYGGTNSRTPPASLSGWSDATQWQNGTASHAIYWRVAQAGDSAPTLSLSGTGVTGDTQLARIHGFYPRTGATITRNQIGTSSTNASADNVGTISGITPTAADLVILTCGKSNDWNGTATLTNWSLATQSESTTGNDAGMALLYQLSSDGSATGSLTVTDNGGTASNGVGFGKLLSFTETLTKTATVSGGMTAAGSATTSFAGTSVTKSYTGSGGSTAGGAATTAVSHIRAYTGSGGAVSGGAASLAKTKSFLPRGGAGWNDGTWFPIDGPMAWTGGTATTEKVAGTGTYSYTGTGGAVSGGTATLVKWKSYIPSGGATSGGSATTAVSHIRAYVGSGGAVSGGSATTSQADVYGYTGTGGATTGGSATVAKWKSYLATGGAVSSGTAATSFVLPGANTFAWVGTGGASTGGSATLAKWKTYTPTGGATSGGAATTGLVIEPPAQTYTYTGSGGSTCGGSATTRLVTAPAVVSDIAGKRKGRFPDWVAPTYFVENPTPTTYSYVGSGGARTGGSAICQKVTVFPYTGRGGSRAGGSATCVVDSWELSSRRMLKEMEQRIAELEDDNDLLELLVA